MADNLKRTTDSVNLNSKKEIAKNAIMEIVEKIEIAKDAKITFNKSEITSLIQKAKSYYKIWENEKSDAFGFLLTFILSSLSAVAVYLFLPHLTLTGLAGAVLLVFFLFFFSKESFDKRHMCEYVEELFGKIGDNKRLKESVKDAIFAINDGKNVCKFNKKGALKYLIITYIIIIFSFFVTKSKEVALTILFIAVWVFWQKNWNIEIKEDENYK
jgi:hypothetical protein